MHTCAYNSEICKSRQSLFSNLITKNVNYPRVLFSTVEKLTIPHTQCPSHFLSADGCNEFASFFKSKLEAIKACISPHTLTTCSFDLPNSLGSHRITFSSVNMEILTETMSRLNSTKCSLDTLPTSSLSTLRTLPKQTVLKLG